MANKRLNDLEMNQVFEMKGYWVEDYAGDPDNNSVCVVLYKERKTFLPGWKAWVGSPEDGHIASCASPFEHVARGKFEEYKRRYRL